MQAAKANYHKKCSAARIRGEGIKHPVRCRINMRTDISARLCASLSKIAPRTNMNLADEQRRLYADLYSKHGDNPRALFHSNAESQKERFEILARCFERETEAFTVHEIGCALGHFGGFLQEYFPLARFSGSEIYEPFVEECRKRFPQGEFHNRDITEELPADRYDFVVIAGTFNIPGNAPRDEWKFFISSMLSAMYAMSKKGIGATFLTGYSDPGYERPDMFYQDEKLLFDFAMRNLSRHVEIDEFGPLYEYGLRVYRPEYVRRLYSQRAFDRYFRNVNPQII
jgi:hypothetical protein